MLVKRNKEVRIGTIVGQDARLQGNFITKESARIDGRVDGDVVVDGMLVLGSTGSVTGSVTAGAVLIGGEVQGNIVAREKAELTATAKVLGDIITKVIVIDENAVFQGKVDMKRDTEESDVKLTALKTTYNTGKKGARMAIAEALHDVTVKQKQAERQQLETLKK